jgi:hypothetical protein
MDFTQPVSFSSTDTYHFGVEAGFTIEGFTPMYLAYVDFLNFPQQSSPPPYPPINPPEDETGYDVNPISKDTWNRWQTGKPADKYDLLFARSQEILSAFNFSCRVDFQITTTDGIELPVPSIHFPLGTPPVKAEGLQNDWMTFLTLPSPLVHVPGPARSKSFPDRRRFDIRR